jgi:hypothetical protein
MLLPQFSLRLMFGIMTGCAVLSAILGLAIRGSAWAIAVSTAVASLAVVATVHVAMFAVVGLFSNCQGARVAGRRGEGMHNEAPPLAVRNSGRGP